MRMINWKQYAMDTCGYEIITTFGNDFDIADAFGLDAIRDTFNRAFQEWKDNYKYLTELALILNWKAWQHSSDDEEKMKLYSELYYQADNYACNNLTGDELTYYYQTTD